MKNTAFIALGTNMGERFLNLSEAIKRLNEKREITLVRSSSIYETEPVGFTEQDPFLNMVIEVRTDFTPLQLLEECLEIELELGRKRIIRWGPRIIDLDILLYNQENMKTEKLFIPHPRLHERAFVLIPLLEISPDERLPLTNQPLQSFLERIPDREGVRIWKRKNGEDVFALFAN